VDWLQEGLRTKRFGKNIVFLREVSSTNDLAKELAGYGADEGTVVVAETQTAGRGRLRREWVSPEGGLYFTVVLRPEHGAGEAVKLAFVAGLAVAEVLRESYGLKAEIKWPNDVLVNGRKVCGILTEMGTTEETVNFVAVGIGVNANFNAQKAFPEEFRPSATSLEDELGERVQLEVLFKTLLERMEKIHDLFIKKGFAPILKGWKEHAGFLGGQVEVVSETEKWVGLALDVEGDGSLVVRLEDGMMRRVFVGDVTLRLG